MTRLPGAVTGYYDHSEDVDADLDSFRVLFDRRYSWLHRRPATNPFTGFLAPYLKTRRVVLSAIPR